MQFAPHPRQHSRNRQHGSALVITLLVVSLLVALVMSFTVYVRFELRNVLTRQDMLAARANARLGANLAIARLQELSGPDTRVTAPTPRGIIPNNAHVGRVFDASAYRDNGSGGLEVNPDFAQNIGFLISGPGFDPDTTTPFQADGTPADGYALLVGDGSVSTATDENGDGVPDGFVAAPVETLPPETGEGAYAWWIGDEGVKAQLNLLDEIDERVSDGELTADQARVARKAATHRSGSEAMLDRYDPENADHREILGKAVNLGQLNLSPDHDLGTDVASGRFHEATLDSTGLLTNTRRGGLQRDLMAVMKETAANSGGTVGGPAWDALRGYQEDRISRWGDETDALEAFVGKPHDQIVDADRPSFLPERHWNAMQALTLRTSGGSPQNDPRLWDRIFPPVSDMHTNFDQGGAGWEQLMTWTTLYDRRFSGGAVRPEARWRETAELSPVIARINLSTYATLDYPEASLHFIPVVVLWNPYSVPIRMKSNPSESWRVVVNYGRRFMDRYTHNYWFRLRTSNPQWTINSGSRYDHIPGRNMLWTPRFAFIWQGLNDDQHIFDLRDVNGGFNVEIGPGQARIFTLHESHVDLTPRGDPDFSRAEIDVDTTVELREGLPRQGGVALPSGGHFSVYRTVNLEDQIDDHPAPRPFPNREGGGGYEAGEGINHWHPLRGSYAVKPYPFPLDPTTMVGVDPADSRWLYNGGVNRGRRTLWTDQPLPPPAICINNEYLRNGWDFHQFGLEFGRDGQGGNERLGGLRVRLQEGTISDLGTETGKILQQLSLPYNRIPSSMSANGGSAHDYDGSPFGGEPPSTPLFDVTPTPADTDPIPVNAPGFPAWGMTWALRLPENSFRIDFETGVNIGGTEDAYVMTQTRWLQDFNPTAPFAIRDPSSKQRFGFDNPSNYVGGFFVGSSRYGELDWATPDGMNQFIGHTDDTLGGTTAILYEIPTSADHITSVASLSQAPLVPTKHDLMPEPRHIRRTSIWTTDREAIPYEMAHSEVNYNYMQPVYMIGNSRAHLMVERDKAVQSFYPNDYFTTPRDSVPYGSADNPIRMSNYGQIWWPSYVPRESYMPGYDSSWMYNEVLWDDFFFTSDLNTRYKWKPGLTNADRDFTTSAEHLVLPGAFNINSLSEDAWVVLLFSMMGLEERDGEALAPFMRFLDPIGDAFDEGLHTVDDEEAYTGYRRLTEDQIRDLAGEIVREVRERGPFLSLSDFVNRALVDSATDTENHGRAGALQAALDATDINAPVGEPSDPDLWLDGPVAYNVPMPDNSNIQNVFAALQGGNVESPLNAGIAGELTQADLLSRIGVALRPRSDTFRIRVQGIHGNVDNPAAKAWCEVIVQRMHEFVDNGNNDPGDPPQAWTDINTLFGRRYRIVSFRWLGEEEI